MTEYRIVIFLDNDKHIWIEFIQDPDSDFPISLETTALIELLDVDNGIDTLHIPDRKRDHLTNGRIARYEKVAVYEP